MRLPLVVGSLVLGSTIVAAGQTGIESRLQAPLKKLFPAATAFSPKEPAPPHFKAFVAGANNTRTTVGLAFLTTELEPLERGYDGPIKILVGMDMNGKLTGVAVIEHREPYGYFSVDRPEFAAQFVGKDIRDPFKAGNDVDAVSRATISINSATRAIRNSARRVARALLTPPGSQ
jgi:NosR/NirI family nitrous oxide reductase transcriptional regulator